MKLTQSLRRFAVLGISILLSASSWAAPDVELMLEDEVLAPSTTLELRFAREMVAKDQLGVEQSESPVVFQPALAGKFTWLSQRSGVFVPSEAPKMGTTFSGALKAGLKDAGGKAIGAKWRTTLKTPPFQISWLDSGVSEGSPSPHLPTVKLAFNRDVKPDGAEKLFRFVDDAGKVIAAAVRYPLPEDYLPVPPEDDDWDRRWKLARDPAQTKVESDSEDDGGEEHNPGPKLNRLIVVPASPLLPGSVWRLEMQAGLVALAGNYRFKEAHVIPLGRVEPFILKTLVTSSYLNNGRSVDISFTHDLAPDVDENTAAKFFHITPEVKNLRFEPVSETITVRGDFQRDVEYRMNFDATLAAKSGLPLSGERSRAFKFDPVKPRIYLPTITGHQSANGLRKFIAHSVNLKSLRVIARLVPPAKAAQAVAAFEKYHKDYQDNDPEPEEHFQAIPAGLIDGKIIADRVLRRADPQLDTKQETAIDWTEILGANVAGTIHVTIEGEPLDSFGGRRPAAQALVQLTDLGVLWKKAGDRLAVTVFSMATGQPAEGARAAMLDKTFAGTSASQTDAAGATSIELGAEPAWLLLSRGADHHVVRMGDGAEDLPMTAFRVPISYDGWGKSETAGPDLRAILFTDRPLYRPGETVRIKGVVRSFAEKGLVMPVAREGTLTLFLPHLGGEKKIDVHLDERGAYDAELVLDSAMTGRYGLSFKMPGTDHGSRYVNFGVADFQPNAFELTVAAPARFAPEAEVAAEVSGRYFFGSNLDKAKVKWTLQYAPQTITPEGFAAFTFGAEAENRKALTLHGEGALSDAGTFVAKPKLPAITGHAHRGTFTIDVTDMNQQTVTETSVFTRDAAAFYIGLEMPMESIVGQKQDIVARAVAVKPDGQPMPEAVDVRTQLVRIRFDTVRAQGAGNAVTFHTERTEEIIGTAEGKTLMPVRDGTDWKLPPGETARFKPGKAGEYLLRTTARDAQGRETVAAFALNVAGDDAISWDYRNPAQVDLVADKAEYRVGDKARILVKTPISGEARVTVERGSRIFRTQRVKLEGNAPTFEIPIEAGDGPNVFVSMVVIRGAEESTRKFKVPEYRYGLCQLHIGDPRTVLKVEIVPQTETVQPGDEVVTEVRVRDGSGASVADAEVTFFAVDDGILAITGYDRPQPHAIFHAPVPLAIRTGLSLYELLPEDPADLEFSNKGYLIGGGGIDGPGIKLRRDFPGTAIWLPTLRTDREGKVTVRFKAPDALTRYRLVAVAHAGSDQFGSGESAFNIRKKLMILSALGQIANVGDEIIARAVLRNESGVDGNATIALELDSTAESAKGELNAKFALKSGEARTVDFPVKLRAVGDASWKWSANLEAGEKKFDDAIAASLKVGHPAPVLHETYLTEVSQASNDLLAGVNPQLLEGDGAVRVTLSNTRLASLRETATALLEYPYGCAEQTVSSLIPWITFNELGPVMPDLAKSREDVQKAIRAGLDKIFALQTDGGGLAYWPGGFRAGLFQSAYAALALGLLEKQGEELPPGWPKLLTYLSGELRGIGERNARFSPGDAALAVYALALAGKAEPAYHEQLFARRAELSFESRALLASAIMEAGGPAKLVGTLLDPRVAAPENFSWFGGANRERSTRLLAWMRFKPGDKEVARLVKELLAARVNGTWRTTQENAWATLALSRYFTAVEREVKPVDGSLVKAGIEAPFALTKKDLTKTVKFAFDPARPLGTLAVANPQKGALFGEANFVVRPPVAAQPRQDRGFAVSRSYQKIAGDGVLAPATDLQVGDRVLVTLRVETPQPGHFVAIDDPLPAILEAINPEFRAQGGEEFSRADYREIRADRVRYFCDHLPAGTFTFHYLARVRTAGTVTAPSTKVEEMYRPERFGLSATAQLVSRASDK